MVLLPNESDTLLSRTCQTAVCRTSFFKMSLCVDLTLRKGQLKTDRVNGASLALTGRDIVSSLY